MSATVSLSTVNGRIDSELPLVLRGSASRRKLEGTLGDGGRRVELETVNGSVHLRKH